ncbi:aspartate/glutamate racemase family protein [Serratia aquatilis]|uniref:Aspartate/glutamate racemase family protein n=1 Tax=Serratia aquatilis TaxID=1737515 RepID=A0ABV6E8Z2_9GAMM
MHIGMIVGIGPAATDYYYRYLISAMAQEGMDLQLTMAHADTPTLLRHQAQNNRAAQVAIYLELANRLKKCGVERIAITSIAGHFCIDEFKQVSPIPVIDLLDTVKAEIHQLGLKRVGLLGTRVVMESHFYGVLDGVQVISPARELVEVHNAYISMASSGVATEQHHEVFMRAGNSLIKEHGCESIMLAGTDLALVFNKKTDPGFRFLDCAEVHAAAIARSAMTP